MRVIIAALAIALLAMVGAVALEASLENAGEDVTIENETWIPDAGNVTQLDDSDRTGAYYAHSVTVYNETRDEMDGETDYQWFAGNGTVKALVGGDLDGDANATITYDYQQTTESQRELAALLGHIPQFLGIALPVFLLIGLIVIVRGG